MHTLGLIPAILIIILLSAMSTSAMFVIGRFKLK